MRQLLEAGVHYGHQNKRWNPKMNRFIFGTRNGVHIIDLQKTVRYFKSAVSFAEQTVAQGGHILFVGTKRQARELVSEHAKRSGMYFINFRWLGGTMTNYQTIRQSIHRLKKFEKMSTDGTFEKLTKKEIINISREQEKLEKYLGGIKDMPGLPSALFVTDAHKETTAILEARKLHIPIIAITDTNCDPSGIDYPIPGNDDSLKSLSLFIKTIADSCIAGAKKRPKDLNQSRDSSGKTKEGTIYDQEGHSVKVLKKAAGNKEESPKDSSSEKSSKE